MNVSCHSTQNELILSNLKEFYMANKVCLEKMLSIITGETKMSLRIVDWFTTNYSKKHFVVYDLNGERFKVYTDYKLKLKAYSKKRFDPFCRWERIQIPFSENTFMETTIGQLNFFKWAFENKVLDYIETNYSQIENDMNSCNSIIKRTNETDETNDSTTKKPRTNRKRRTELSISASKSIKKEDIEIVVSFN
jgi:hypothetical protein